MGTYEDCCFTINPDSQSVDDVKATLDDFIARSFEDLPNLPDHIVPYSEPKDYFERDRLNVETDGERGQVYLGGRTHRSSNWWAWRYWIRSLGIGDGLVALIWWHEDPSQGYAELWRWDETTAEYVDMDVNLDTEDAGNGREIYLGEEGAKGAKIAEQLAEVADITPARHNDLKGILLPGDDNFVPLHYRQIQGDS